MRGLMIEGWMAINDARLTKLPVISELPASFVGQRQPDTARFSNHLSAQQDVPLAGGLTGFAGLTLTYIGDRKGVLVEPRADFPGFGRADLRAGVKWADSYIQPRTVGVTISKSF